MVSKVSIAKKFNGPPKSGNGGYVCGLLAKHAKGVSEVTLHKPPPLDVPLEVLLNENSGLYLSKNEVLIASSKLSEVSMEIPTPPTFDEAALATEQYIARKDEHIFPTCFVCGPARKPGDGLRIFAGQIEHKKLFAAPWVPHISLADNSGRIHPEVIWASLDCPGYFSLMGDQFKPMLLGRMACEVLKPVYANEQYIVVAWPLGSEGRKHFCGTAIFNSQNQVCAKAKATWISIDLKTIET